MNIQTQGIETLNECDDYLHRWCSIIGNLGVYIRTFISNKYLRVENLNHKFDQIFKLRDENVTILKNRYQLHQEVLLKK